MSSAFLTLTASSRVHAQRLAFTSLTARRALTQTSLRRDAPGGLKEDAIADLSSESTEIHKRDSLEKQKQGKGHWKPELASVSEESVKADRSGPRKTDPESIRLLQEQTKYSAEERAKKGTSVSDGLEEKA